MSSVAWHKCKTAIKLCYDVYLSKNAASGPLKDRLTRAEGILQHTSRSGDATEFTRVLDKSLDDMTKANEDVDRIKNDTICVSSAKKLYEGLKHTYVNAYEALRDHVDGLEYLHREGLAVGRKHVSHVRYEKDKVDIYWCMAYTQTKTRIAS
jgi:hypothetical protein